MKRTYLVKGEERIEVTRSCESGWLCLKENGWRATQQFVESIGYKLEEVEERREFYITNETYNFAQRACDLGDYRQASVCFYPHKDHLKDLIHVVEIREGERVLSREDISTAYDTVVGYSVGSQILKDLIKQLGFPEGDS